MDEWKTLAAGCLARPDFYEGVRARLVDKGAKGPPVWNPARLEDVAVEDVVGRCRFAQS